MAEATPAAKVEKNVKAKAIHQIHHGDHEKQIVSGTVFSAPQSQVDRLVSLGAAELVAEAPAEPAAAAK